MGLGKTIEAGLVIQEMLLRHRARRVLVVCPASLTLKWHEEMAAKFGLDFRVLDTAALRELRRTHGLEANPFAVYPRIIISLQWLRTPRVQRLLDEVLTPQTRYPGYFDLLIVDEVHHCAPPEPPRERGYAVDSMQTQAVRRLGEHSQHRLFLSATPHDGYPGSWRRCWRCSTRRAALPPPWSTSVREARAVRYPTGHYPGRPSSVKGQARGQARSARGKPPHKQEAEGLEGLASCGTRRLAFWLRQA